MTSSRRLDITIGLLAAAIAVLGFGISLLARNEDGGLFGPIARKDQASLLAIAVTVLGLTIAKAISARRR